MHSIVVVALDQVVVFDLSIACETFGHAFASDGTPLYEVMVCGARKRVRSAYFWLDVPFAFSALDAADTIILPGVSDPHLRFPASLLDGLRTAHRRGARIASICSGAFVLAASGLLDGRRATTHWRAAAELQRRHPAIEVDPKVLFVDEGTILTSAGASAGMDLCFHMIRRDHGSKIAADAARLAVAAPERHGGQAQFIALPPPASSDNLAPVLEWMQKHLARQLGVSSMARRARMSERTFCRRFREQTGTTPLQWLLMARIRHAQALLETTELGIEAVASAAGFETALNFRRHFRRISGTSPREYRQTFGGGRLAQ
jgi:transcriptional regulator GlxA family with amidase domain